MSEFHLHNVSFTLSTTNISFFFNPNHDNFQNLTKLRLVLNFNHMMPKVQSGSSVAGS